VRIIGGLWRGKTLFTPADDRIRPTADRTREAVFNLLAHRPDLLLLTGAHVLDGFCGTGAFALECLSRGAARALGVDSSASSLALARRNAERLGASLELLRADMSRLPERSAFPFTHVYLDPPYGKELAEPTLASLRKGWLVENAIVLVEQDMRDPVLHATGYALTEQRTYGRARISLLRPI
jgi:16S rRNA (guanine966-N2)-methyltransferase